jgi:hypothetical protein
MSDSNPGVVLNAISLLVPELKAYLTGLAAGRVAALPDYALAAAAAAACPTPGGAHPKPPEVKVLLNTLDTRLDALSLEGAARAERKALLLELSALHSLLVRLPAPDPPDFAVPAATAAAPRALKTSPPPKTPPPPGFARWLLVGAAPIAAAIAVIAAVAAWARSS